TRALPRGGTGSPGRLPGVAAGAIIMTDPADSCNHRRAAAAGCKARIGAVPYPVPPPPADLISLSRGLTAHLSVAEADLAAQQAVRGLDALDEVHLHRILAAAVESVGCGVLREVPYPGEAAGRPSRGRRPRRSERERCDLVLTPLPGQPLADPVEALVERDRVEATLFAQLADEPAPIPLGEPAPCSPEDALWLEI